MTSKMEFTIYDLLSATPRGYALRTERWRVRETSGHVEDKHFSSLKNAKEYLNGIGAEYNQQVNSYYK